MAQERSASEEQAASEATATPPPQAPSHAAGSADGRKQHTVTRYVEYVVHANAAITLLGWVRYWSRRRWMPYHGQVAGLRWHELQPSLQLLFLTMSRTASTACALCALSTVALSARAARAPHGGAHYSCSSRCTRPSARQPGTCTAAPAQTRLGRCARRAWSLFWARCGWSRRDMRV